MDQTITGIVVGLAFIGILVAEADQPAPGPAVVAFADLDPLLQQATIWTVQLAPHAEREVRIDTFDGRSNRTGHVIVDPQTGRFDMYDKRSNRTGTGTITPPLAPGQVPARLRFDGPKGGGR